MGVSQNRSRVVRLEKQLKVILAEALQEWSRSSKLCGDKLATLNHVVFNKDLSVVRAYVSFIQGNSGILGSSGKNAERKDIDGADGNSASDAELVEEKQVLSEFGNLAKRDRGKLTRSLGLMRAPRLEFVHDTSPDFCNRLDFLLAQDGSTKGTMS